MRCLNQRKFLFLTALFALWLSFTYPVEASPYYITHPTYFPSKSGSYITFDSSLLPISFNTVYRDTQTRWHFNDYWVSSTIDMTITVWFTSNWMNYTVNGASTQELYNGTKPVMVQFNGVNQTEGDTWSYSNGITTVTPSSTDVALYWGGNGASENGELSIYTLLRGNYYLTFGLISLAPIVLISVLLVGAIKGRESLEPKDMIALFSMIFALIIAYIIIVVMLNAFIGA